MCKKVLSYIRMFLLLFMAIFIVCFIILFVIAYCTYGLRRTFTGTPIPVQGVFTDPLIFSSVFSAICSILLVGYVIIDDNSDKSEGESEDTDNTSKNESGNS